jgi:hypothetical protein
MGRFDQHIDTTGSDGELAPGLVVDRHAVFDALGAADALGVAGDQVWVMASRWPRGRDRTGRARDARRSVSS